MVFFFQSYEVSWAIFAFNMQCLRQTQDVDPRNVSLCKCARKTKDPLHEASQGSICWQGPLLGTSWCSTTSQQPASDNDNRFDGSAKILLSKRTAISSQRARGVDTPQSSHHMCIGSRVFRIGHSGWTQPSQKCVLYGWNIGLLFGTSSHKTLCGHISDSVQRAIGQHSERVQEQYMLALAQFHHSEWSLVSIR